MTHYSRTAWCEGMFLRPQHFQQSERAIEQEFKGLNRFQQPYNWGVYKVRVNSNSLKEGLVEVESIDAILPDMTVVQLQNTSAELSPLSIEKGTQDTLVKLTVPAKSLKEKMVADVSEGLLSRYLLKDIDVIDVQTGQDEECIQVASLNMALKANNEKLSGFVELPILKVKEVTSEGVVILDDEFTPPNLNALNDQAMMNCLKNVSTMTKIRADVVSQRLLQGKMASASAVDFIMLQMLNRYEMVLKHLGKLDQIHPLELITLLKGYVGELSTFSSKTKRIPALSDYDHINLTPVVQELNQVL
ncbi:type VI secretion system baseplate subunit TssK, partial [Vibrio owensii]